MNPDRLLQVQETLREEGLDGWIFASFRGSDPIALKVLGLPDKFLLSRRWFYFIPATGEPVRLCHGIEPHSLDGLPGRFVRYGRWQEWQAALAEILKGKRRVAAQYSAGSIVPALGRMDAGLGEFLRSLGVELVSSGDLVARFEVTLSDAQEAGHYRAVKVLEACVEMAFSKVREALRGGAPLTEYALQQEMLSFMESKGLTTEAAPIVGVDAHAADPHYEPSPSGSSVIGNDQVLLLDLWGKETAPGSVYGDLTWCAWTGTAVPEEQAKVWSVVTAARDAGCAKAEEVAARAVRGWEVDRATRDVIEKAGYGEFFIHRTGHSIHEEDHGDGANMDDYETRDERRLLDRTLFSVEPGIYLPGRFGFRSEVNVLVKGGKAVVTGKRQGALACLGA
jgi:Xaa-Pro dipeptidase